MTVAEMREQRTKLVADARALVDKAEAEKREMTTEENTNFDKAMADSDAIAEKIAQREKLEAKEKELRSSQGRIAGGKDGGEPGKENRKTANADEKRAWQSYLRTGDQSYTSRGQRELVVMRDALRSAGYEERALQMDSDIAGGFLVAPQEFVGNLIQFVNDQVWMRQPGFATVMSVQNAESLGVPTLDADPADADWTAEIATGSEDSTMKFGKRELRPHPLAKRIKVAGKLLRASGVDVEAVVIERLSYKFGIAAEKGYLTGTGAEQPLGVFTASANGIDTTRDVSTGNTTTAIGADGLIEAKFKLKANYWPRAKWLFHRDALKQIRKLKDGNGQYLWLPYGFGLSNAAVGNNSLTGVAGQLLELPVYLSEYAPNTFTTGLYVGLLGDFSRYWIADSLALNFQRLIELYAEAAQVGFIGRLESDGMPVLAEAFSRVALA